MYRRSILIGLMAVLLLAALPASAAVSAADLSASLPDGIYVAGHNDAYPFEYYNAQEERYEGVLPQALELVSQHTGLDFVYLHSGFFHGELAKNAQVELVSCYDPDSAADYAVDSAMLLSYEEDGEEKQIGFAFTKVADAGLIQRFKEGLAQISTEEINGLFAGSQMPTQRIHPMLLVSIAAVFALLLLIILRDAVQMRRVRNQSRISGMTDAETGIGNLAYFQHHFDHSISDASRSLYYVAYLIVEGDYLRSYYRDSTFSDVVKYTAGVISAYIKHNEILARIAENGFAFAFQCTGREEAERQMMEIIGKLNHFLEEDGQNSKPAFHAAVYNLSRSDRSSELILMNLRRNCIKLAGQDTQLIFCDSHSMRGVHEEKLMVESINRGFENHEFKLYMQFIVNNKTKEIVSAEALSRWDNPEKGLLTPNKYIDVMESTALISRLDFYMFEMVCRQLVAWKDGPYAHLSMSCNFTRITLSESGFIERIREISDKYSFDRSKILIEITEDAIEKDFEQARQNVSACKQLGFRIALDDLGSGNTSLINLCDYPIDVVKLDREILLKTDVKRGRKLFNGVVALAHSLNLKVVCEGVENEEQVKLVSESECDYIQGWYFSRVYPQEECEMVMRQYAQNMNKK